MNIALKTAEGAAWNLLANVGQHVVNFLFFVYMARVLEPSVFGLMALALVVVEILVYVGRIGLLEASVQETDMDDVLQNEMFWVLGITGTVTALIVLLGASSVSQSLGHSELSPVLMWLAPVCLIQNISAVPESRLQKIFGYKVLAHRTLLGVSCGGAAGVVLAFFDYGIYSLVFQRIVTAVVQSAILWRSETWRPRYFSILGHPKLSPLICTGAQIMSAGFMLMMNTKLMDVLVGTFLGPTMLGYLRTAWKCLEVILFCTVYPLVGVALVTFTALKNDNDRLRRAYAIMTEMASLALFPVLLGISAVAPLLVPLLFGEKWVQCVSLLQVLGFLAFFGTIGPFFSPVVTATGHSKLLVSQGLLQISLSVLFTVGAIPFGVLAVVVGQVFRLACVAVYNVWVMKRKIGLPYAVTGEAILPASVASISMWFSIAGLIRATSLSPIWEHLVLMVTLGCVLYFAVLIIFFREKVLAIARGARGLRFSETGGR
jgi:O-antigen/teichoic acid export membrane protein